MLFQTTWLDLGRHGQSFASRAIGPDEIINISSKTATPGYHSSLLMLYRSNEKMTAIEYYYNFFW